ncbi:MAG TPA: mechanosensitive ion channel domain-containing protein [Polyangiaceae bacterium]|nr:mechanosensitive ion channel domain-containing protein [Polyangiaceae bacterium]
MIRLCLLVLALVALALPASAESPSAGPSASAAMTPNPPSALATPVSQVEAPVIVLNRQIATLRSPLFGIGPEERARRTAARIHDVLERGGPGHVTIRHEPQGSFMLIDGAFALVLTPDDADKLEGETLEAATDAARRALERVVAETLESRSHARLVKALGREALATAGLIVAFLVVFLARRTLVRRITRVLQERASGVRLGGPNLLHPARLFGLSRWVVRAFTTLALLVLTYRWVSFSLNQFPYTRPWGEHLDAFLINVALDIGGGMVRAIPDLLVAVLILAIARALIRLVRPFFDSVERGHLDLGWVDGETARATRRIVGLVVWMFAIVMAYPYLPGSGSEAFKGITVLFGLMATLGGSSLFGQAASGLILLYSRTVRVGEYVRIGDQEGTVTELGTFTTKIRTGLGEEVTLPNAVVLGTVTKNYSRPAKDKGFFLDTTVTIGYDVPWRQVQAILIEGAVRTEGIVATPPPRVFATALSDFYIEYRLVCECHAESARSRAHALHELHVNVLDVFNEHGVQIMSPHYFSDPAAKKVVPKSTWYAPPAKAPEGGDAT